MTTKTSVVGPNAHPFYRWAADELGTISDASSFESLEKEASDAELRSLVDAAGQADHVHVVLSANVFIAPLRALA